MHRVSHYLRASQHSVLYHIQAAAEARAQLVSAPYEQRRAFLAALRESIAQDEFHIERANRHDCEAFAMQKQRISVTAAPYLPYTSSNHAHHHDRLHKSSKDHSHTSTTASATQQTTHERDSNSSSSSSTHYEGNSKDDMNIQPHTISSSSTTLISSHTRYAPSALSPLRLDKLYRGIDAIAALPDPIAPPSSAAWLMHDKINSTSEWREEQTTGQPQANTLSSSSSSSSSSTPVQAEVVEVSVPMGLVAILSRYRPRMCVDAVAMGILAGNALLLDGGAALSDTNTALMHCVRNALRHVGLPLTAVSYVEGNERGDDLTSHSHSTLFSSTTINEYSEAAIGDDATCAQKAHKRLAQPDFTHHLSRSSTATLQWLKQKNSPIDCVLICGPGRLFDFARRHSTLPIIRATAQGASLYIDVSASYEMALEIVLNAKLQRCGAANAVTTLLVHKKFIRATELLAALNHYAIELHAEVGTIELCAQLDTNHNIRFIVAEEEDYRDESLIAQHPRALCVKFVASVDEALHFLDLFGARQVDGIVACDANVIARFAREVDTAVVVINSSTRLCSGQALQRGWDLALSTSKLHCRGPVSMGVFTTRKLLVRSPDLHTPILRK